MPQLQPLVYRILSRLSEAQAEEPDPWLRDDLKIACLIVAHAARGDAVLCTPDVLASYEVLGLHPKKVWPAIQARHEALGEISCAPAVRKKPPRSVKLWCNENGVRAINSHAAMQEGSPRTTISVPMATPSIAAAYPNSDDSGSAKERPFFTVADLQDFFENCPPELVEYRCLRTIKGMFRALEKRLGKKLQGGSFEFCLAVEDYRAGEGRYRSTSTVRINLRRAEKFGYLEAIYGADEMGRPRRDHFWHRPRTKRDRGLYRRVATYRLNTTVLEKWRDMQRHGHKAAEPTPIRKPAAPAPPHQPAPAAPLPQREKPAATIEKAPQPKLSKRDCDKFMGLVAGLKLGRTRHTEAQGGYGYDLSPGDSRYKAPMKELEAIRTVCKAWRREFEVVLYALKFWGYQVETEGER